MSIRRIASGLLACIALASLDVAPVLAQRHEWFPERTFRVLTPDLVLDFGAVCPPVNDGVRGLPSVYYGVVRNQGTGPAAASRLFMIDSGLGTYENYEVPPLAPGEGYELFIPSGSQNLQFWVDANRTSGERTGPATQNNIVSLNCGIN
jgi:hypothetical protein